MITCNYFTTPFGSLKCAVFCINKYQKEFSSIKNLKFAIIIIIIIYIVLIPLSLLALYNKNYLQNSRILKVDIQ